MKSIILTEEHRIKLLEMCAGLFPETIWFFWLDDTCGEMNETHLGYNQTIKLGDKTHPFKDGLMMHWFEFCILHVFTKLDNKSKTPEWEFSLSDLLCLNIHPIDYLYIEFKNLN